ncbi:hypothetical protein [Actinoplanes sp. NPDC020271]|uniref:hypothetical protein n=1 Tax=Actinoplanes sp. NPDC020271 TaxID=3363896 RepID=UPI00378DCE8D
MLSDVVPVASAVSGRVALRRAAVGAGLAAAACVVISLAGHPTGAFADVTVLTWSTIALFSADERHSRIAVTAAAVTALLLWLGTAPIVDAGVPGHVARALLGAAAGSQVYALVTRAGLEAR